MNKIIPSIAVIVLCGCSTQQIRTPDASARIEPVNPSSPTTSEAGQTQPEATRLTKTPATPVNRHLAANRPLRQHSIIPVNRSEKQKDTGNQESLIPRITRYIKQGIASWYGPRFHGRKTANGEIFDMYAMTAAHKTLPIPSYAQVTNLDNNRSIIVRINDRGPYVGDRLLDLSYAAAKKLGIAKEGLGKVEIVALTENQALPELLDKESGPDAKEVSPESETFGSLDDDRERREAVAAHRASDAKFPSLAYKRSTF
ncbi:MAG: septal ring lytic transglycosylase RlpA family protein [Gammaproteobacteria bacterium]